MKRPLLLLCVLLAACGTESPTATPAVSVTPPATVVATAPPVPTTPPPPTPDPGAFEIERAMDHVRALAVEIGTREAGSEGDVRAATYIENELREIGWSAEQEVFPLPQGGESTNVIGMPPGFDVTKPYVIVGGHRDSLAGPGANDNATGIAAALEIARAVDARPAPLPVMFVAFGAEERQPAPDRPHHIGSVAFVNGMPEAERKALAVFVNLDMIGHGDTVICGQYAAGPSDGSRRCVELAAKLGIAARNKMYGDVSDHTSFADAGMNAAWLYTGPDPCCYHNAADVFDRVRPDDVRRAGAVGLEIVRSYTGVL